MSVAGVQEYTTEVAATPAECFDAIMDFEAYPKWSSAVKYARVVERDQKGYGRIVEFRIDLPLKTIRYVLEYTHKKPSELRWRSVDGDIESIEGHYSFKKSGPKGARVTCQQSIRIGFWLPGPLRNLLERTALRDSVEEFKAEVERRKRA